VHVLVDCPTLRKLRQQLRNKIGDAFNNVSIMLGGKPQGKTNGCAINRDILTAVLEFAEASQRFRTGAAEGGRDQTRRQRD
jgi:hypothetical protein